MNPKPQKWRRAYRTKTLTITTEQGGIWEIEGAGVRWSSLPGKSVEQMQQRAHEIAAEPPSDTWRRICRTCDEPMQQRVESWVCRNLHEEDVDEE